MGYRLHYAKKYDVEWAGGWFSWQKYDWDMFVREHLPSAWQSGDMFGGGEEYEIDPSELREAITELNKKPAEKNKYLSDYTNGEIAEILTQMLDTPTSEEGFIRLTWF